MRRMLPLTVTLAMLAAAASAVPAAAQGRYSRAPVRGHVGSDNVFRVGLSALTPRGDGDYWADKQREFTGEPDDLQAADLGIDYQRLLSARLGLQVSGNFYDGATDQSYLRFTDLEGRAITHTTTLERNNLTAGLLFHPIGHDAVIAPYLGAGVGVYDWRLEESGDFINFRAPAPIIFTDTFTSEGTDFGWYWQAGLEVPAGRRWAVYAEARWDRAEAELEGDFEDFGELDLSSRQYGLGISWAF